MTDAHDPNVPPPVPGESDAAPHDSIDAAPVALTQEHVQSLLDAKDAEATERLQRLAAEYQNYRRRSDRERELAVDDALGRLVADLLPVFDSFDKALALRADPAAAASGIETTDKVLRAALAKHQIAPVDPAGEPFDPKSHEAILRTPSADAAPGTILAVLEKGWTLRARLVRPARVAVAVKPE